ncbi:MAG: family N-acetyltransferase [Proteobacteria bacterium]|nr:family N-acetyltransferase [Pseudomonadota bacterium]
MLPGYASYTGSLNIRPARPEDSGFVEMLYRSTRDDLRLIAAEDDFIEELIGMQQQAQTVGYGDMFPNAMYFIVERLGDRIGRIVVDFGHNEVRLVDVAFVPQARSSGYGTEILRLLQTAAMQARAPLALSVQRSNLRAKQLYAALGFVSEGGDTMYERLIWYPA